MLVTTLLIACLLLVQTIALFRLARKIQTTKEQVYNDIIGQVNAWTGHAEGKQSALGEFVGSLGDILAERLFTRLKMSLNGEISGAARRKGKAESDTIVPGDMLAGLAQSNPMAAIFAKFLPGLMPGGSVSHDNASVDTSSTSGGGNFNQNLSRWR